MGSPHSTPSVCVDVVVVNRVWPEPERDCALCSPSKDRTGLARADRRDFHGTDAARGFRRSSPSRVGSRRCSPWPARSGLDLRRRPEAGPAPRRADREATRRCDRVADRTQQSISRSFWRQGRCRKDHDGGGGGDRARRGAAARARAASLDRSRPLRSATSSRRASPTRHARVDGAPPNLESASSTPRTHGRVERQRYREGINDLFDSIFRGRMDASFDRAVLEDLLDLAPPADRRAPCAGHVARRAGDVEDSGP